MKKNLSVLCLCVALIMLISLISIALYSGNSTAADTACNPLEVQNARGAIAHMYRNPDGTYQEYKDHTHHESVADYLDNPDYTHRTILECLGYASLDTTNSTFPYHMDYGSHVLNPTQRSATWGHGEPEQPGNDEWWKQNRKECEAALTAYQLQRYEADYLARYEKPAEERKDVMKDIMQDMLEFDHNGTSAVQK